jgi:hypothetical protein
MLPRERRRAKRIQPKEPVEVQFPRDALLKALDISETGLLVEDASPFKPGSICELDLRRSGRAIRLRVEVVRSVVAGGGKGSSTGIRYRTGFHFLENAPPAFFTLFGELSES